MNLTLDFFPMRPAATKQAPEQWLAKMRENFVCQPKLNGDRAVLWVKSDGIYIQNRRGGEYTFMVRNRSDFEKLPVGTILDGEVWSRNLHPFECLAYGDLDLTNSGSEVRCKYAEKICAMLGHDFLFAEVTPEWLASADRGIWEGFVAKKRGEAYRPTGKVHQESFGWYKFKWA